MGLLSIPFFKFFQLFLHVKILWFEATLNNYILRFARYYITFSQRLQAFLRVLRKYFFGRFIFTTPAFGANFLHICLSYDPDLCLSSENPFHMPKKHAIIGSDSYQVPIILLREKAQVNRI